MFPFLCQLISSETLSGLRRLFIRLQPRAPTPELRVRSREVIPLSVRVLDRCFSVPPFSLYVALSISLAFPRPRALSSLWRSSHSALISLPALP